MDFMVPPAGTYTTTVPSLDVEAGRWNHSMQQGTVHMILLEVIRIYYHGHQEDSKDTA